VPIFPIAAHFSHQNKQQGRFSGREIDIAFFEKKMTPGMKINWRFLYIGRKKVFEKAHLGQSAEANVN